MPFSAAFWVVLLLFYRSAIPYTFLPNLSRLPRLGLEIGILLVFLFLIGTTRRRFLDSFSAALKAPHWKVMGLLLLAWFPVLFLLRIFNPSYDSWLSSGRLHPSFFTFGFLSTVLPLQLLKEEVLERGLIQPLLSKILPPRWLAVVIAFGFATAHLSTHDPLPHAVTTWVGVATGSTLLIVIYLRTGSLFLAFLMHLAADLLSTLQTYFHVAGYPIAEVFFWLTYGAGFIWALPKIQQIFVESFPGGSPALSHMQKAFAVLAGIAIPFSILWFGGRL